MSIIAEALKKAQKRQTPHLPSDIKTHKQPVLGPSSNHQKKEKKFSSRKKNSFLTGAIIFTVLLILCLAVVLTYTQNLQKIYVNQPVPVVSIPANTHVSTTAPIAKSKPVEEKELFRLNGIVQDGNKPLAVINDRIVETGETITGAKVIEINDDSVKLTYKGKNLTLYLER